MRFARTAATGGLLVCSNAEAEPQDDSETALYSQTDIDTLRAENERLRTCFDRGADKWETFARAAGWVPPKRQDDAPLDFDGDFEEDLWDERDE